MHGKFVSVSAVVSAKGMIAVYAVDNAGKVWEELPGIQNSSWVNIT